ncbi:MAG: hypothetical protein Crog4KO_31910 [Crocinitomicaceae bacterium]
MKLLTTTILLLSSWGVMSQIKFSDNTFDNGMLYPIAHYSGNATVSDSMNAIIQRNLTDAEISDFCIGDYGFYQKGNHLELHLICNCIDFAETEHKYLFFSLETGTLVSYTDLFESKEKDAALRQINNLIRKAENAEFGDMTEDLNWSEMTVRLYKDGLEIHPASGISESPVQIPWTEVSTYLKYSYL